MSLVRRAREPRLVCRVARSGKRWSVHAALPSPRVRRQKVLAIQARDGGQYTVAIDDPNTDPIILSLGTPDGMCEVLIPKDRYDPFAIAAMVVRWNPEHHVPRSTA
jgi:hypothetical protein